MNRTDEFEAMIQELNRPAPGLDGTLDRACRKRRKKIRKMVVRPLAAMASCFAVFVLLVNFCLPVAYACSQIPGLKELAEAVTFSRSLTDAVNNEYVQPMELSQTEQGITAQIAYLIVDQKQVNIFYRLESDRYEYLEINPQTDSPCILVYGSFGGGKGELRSFTADFVDEDVPDSMQITLRVYSGSQPESTEPFRPEQNADEEDTHGTREYLAEFTFQLEFDPAFTASGKVFPVNQTVLLDGQSITVTEIKVYPTHLRVEITEAAENTAWIKDLDFYIETDWGMKFDPVSGGITATGADGSPSMVSYRADSTYFYEAKRLKLVITGAKWLRKDMETLRVNLATGEHGELPEGAALDEAERSGGDWTVTFRVEQEEGEPMHQLFEPTYFDAEGNAYRITLWSTGQRPHKADGSQKCFYVEFSLEDYPYDEVWFSPMYSHSWDAEDRIVITVQ